MKNIQKEPLVLSVIGYVFILVFFIAFIFLYVFSSISISWGWIEIPPVLSFIVSLLCALPILIPFIWSRLTKLRLFDFEISLSDISASINQALPNELKDSKRIQLAGTLAPDVVYQIINSIKSSSSSEIVEVNIGYGKIWLVTRLYLLATIADDYTDIKQITFLENFEGQDRSYIGMAPPKIVRKILALNYPVLEKAYRELRTQSVIYENSHSVEDEMKWMVQNFGLFLQKHSPGDESELIMSGSKEWVTKDLLSESIWFDKYSQKIIWTDGIVNTILLYRIMKCTAPYVALIEDRELKRIVDRFDLALHIADSFLTEKIK